MTQRMEARTGIDTTIRCQHPGCLTSARYFNHYTDEPSCFDHIEVAMTMRDHLVAVTKARKGKDNLKARIQQAQKQAGGG